MAARTRPRTIIKTAHTHSATRLGVMPQLSVASSLGGCQQVLAIASVTPDIIDVEPLDVPAEADLM